MKFKKKVATVSQSTLFFSLCLSFDEETIQLVALLNTEVGNVSRDVKGYKMNEETSNVKKKKTKNARKSEPQVTTTRRAARDYKRVRTTRTHKDPRTQID